MELVSVSGTMLCFLLKVDTEIFIPSKYFSEFERAGKKERRNEDCIVPKDHRKLRLPLKTVIALKLI